jgi:glycosidase
VPTNLNSTDLLDTIKSAMAAAARQDTKTVVVDGKSRQVPFPFPSPADWRQSWIYFLMLDRFANPAVPPAGAWNRVFSHRQGGTFRGVQAQLGYLSDLGVKALWLSPVLKNSKPDFNFNYHGYATQDFLNVDERFASDGTRATAERELTQLIDEAHARGMYVIFDIVLNHAGRVFDYRISGNAVSMFADPSVMNVPLGHEPSIEWLDKLGSPRSDWTDDALPAPASLTADDAVWPSDLQNRLFFRRRGSKLTDKPGSQGFVPGDFGDMRQLVAEYDASVPGQEDLRAKYGAAPVISILVRAYQYLMARFDVDGYRIDTVKYVYPEGVRNFGNAMREFGLTIGKENFFTFGEVYDDEETIAGFVGRRTKGGEGFGIDAALDFPLFYKLPAVAKSQAPVETIRNVFEDRKAAERDQLSSHGEAGRYFVSFLDNHDQHERIQHPSTPVDQVTLALGLLFTLQGIPCLYYGTEQGLSGTVDGSGSPDLNSNESTREALWGKTPVAFDPKHPNYQIIKALSALRQGEPALSYGRFYFREVSGNGTDFGHSSGNGGIVAFSRILAEREVLVVANTSTTTDFSGSVLVDRDLNATPRQMGVVFSNMNRTGTGTVQHIAAARFFQGGSVSTAAAAALPVLVKAGEIQILAAV